MAWRMALRKSMTIASIVLRLTSPLAEPTLNANKSPIEQQQDQQKMYREVNAQRHKQNLMKIKDLIEKDTFLKKKGGAQLTYQPFEVTMQFPCPTKPLRDSIDFGSWLTYCGQHTITLLHIKKRKLIAQQVTQLAKNENAYVLALPHSICVLMGIKQGYFLLLQPTTLAKLQGKSCEVWGIVYGLE